MSDEECQCECHTDPQLEVIIAAVIEDLRETNPELARKLECPCKRGVKIVGTSHKKPK